MKMIKKRQLPDIGILGLAGSGKTTAAHTLMAHGYTPLAFADPLKELCATALGWDGNKDARGRQLLQEVGCAAREYDPQIWLNKMAIRALRLMQSPPFVFHDVRFQNEADFVRRRGGFLLRIVRPGIVPGSHTSETSGLAIAVDWEIINDGTLECLKQQLDKIIDSL